MLKTVKYSNHYPGAYNKCNSLINKGILVTNYNSVIFQNNSLEMISSNARETLTVLYIYYTSYCHKLCERISKHSLIL